MTEWLEVDQTAHTLSSVEPKRRRRSISSFWAVLGRTSTLRAKDEVESTGQHIKISDSYYNLI